MSQMYIIYYGIQRSLKTSSVNNLILLSYWNNTVLDYLSTSLFSRKKD